MHQNVKKQLLVYKFIDEQIKFILNNLQKYLFVNTHDDPFELFQVS